MKRLVSIIASAAMMIGLSPVCLGTAANAAGNEASVDGTEYATLKEAVDHAADNSTITVLQDAAISQDLDFTKAGLTLDLNGKMISTDGKAFNVKSGSLSVTGNGSVTDDHSFDQKAYEPMFDVNGGSLTISTGTYTSKEIEIVRVENGTADILGGSFVCNGTNIPDKGKCIMVANGSSAKLTIEAGTLTAVTENTTTAGGDLCGMNGVAAFNGGTIVLGKQSNGTGPTITADYSVIGGNNIYSPANVTVYGGKYIMDAASDRKAGSSEKFDTVIYMPCNGNLNIYGGTFDATSGPASHVISVPYSNTAANINIAGGYFKANTASSVFYIGNQTATYGTGKPSISITHGSYTDNPIAYVKEGYSVHEINDSGCKYTVIVALSTKTATVTASTVDDSQISTPEGEKEMTAADKTALLETAAAVKPAADDTAMKKAAQAVKPSKTAEEARKTLEAATKTSTAGQDINFVVKALFNVKPEYYNAETNEITMDIKPMYEVYATTSEDTTVNKNNSVMIESGVLDTGTKPVEITTEIPSSMAVSDGNGGYKPLSIRHEKENGNVYYYTASVAKTGNVYNATFTVTHGFSQFTLMPVNSSVVKVNFDTVEKAYAINDISSSLPSTSKDGYTFTGWKFDGIDGVYNSLTEDLFKALTKNGSASVTAYAQFTQDPAGSPTDDYVAPDTAVK
ncbi:MAG: hypothetical protein LKF53_04100 [Solobacterium sp.]|jgi:uncharacterized repeat protein (TIGR02543 family)|nr:hypothetical protein [Solobacterium sp.]MCH4205556.1 hypothetical protein [Solobacterium sp.]MCH4227109.1 hypothetical protein [Solobacterium sp.]MCH4282319.1 hypothetical protein [Solobacterium sp.]